MIWLWKKRPGFGLDGPPGLGGGRRYEIKTDAQLGKMREAGLVVAEALRAMREAVKPGVTTADLDAVAAKVIADAGALSNFKGYHGFPATICASVNEEIVHGIPSVRKVLEEGDVVSLDCGAIVDGWHGDAAITVPVGEAAAELTELMRVTEQAMWRGIEATRADGRLSDIGHAIESHVMERGQYSIPEHYGGHGIGSEMHMDPFVHNFGRPGKGPRLWPGMCLAIEPMVTLGSREAVELDDGWTVVTKDGKLSAHFEHTVAVTENGPWVLTAPESPGG